MAVRKLNDSYGIQGRLSFKEDAHGLIVASLESEEAYCELYLYGAHVSRLFFKEGEDLLWMSPTALFQPPKAIRGGVPVCWPWFGPAENKRLPQHGFARNSLWHVQSATLLEDAGVELTLELPERQAHDALWPYHFELRYLIRLFKDRLELRLQTSNRDSKAFSFNAALHSYFAVSDIEKTEILGLDQSRFIDQTDAHVLKRQHGSVRCEKETDRIYLETSHPCIIKDNATKRSIVVDKEGSDATVVWNPWQDKAKAMLDFEDEGYRKMICVESLIHDQAIMLAPGSTYELIQKISFREELL